MVKKRLIAAAGLAVVLAGGVAMAQGSNGPPDRDQQGEARRGPDGGPREGRMGGFMRMHMRPSMTMPSKAAHFRFRRGDAMIDIKCADDEPMKACVDAGTALLDKATPPAK